MNEQMVLRALGGIRLGVGVGLVVAPTVAGRIWVGDDATGAGTRVFARALGARDTALGVALLTALHRGEVSAAASHARTGVVADVADVLATIVASRNLQGSRRWVMPLIAAAVGAAGAVVWNVSEDAEEQDDVATVAGREDGSVSVAETEGIVDQQAAALAAMDSAVAGGEPDSPGVSAPRALPV